MSAEVAKFIKHVSFDDLAPTMIDDHAQALKASNKHIGFNNQFLHVPPQFNPMYHTEAYDFGDWSFTSRSPNSRSGRRLSDQNSTHRDKVEKMFAFTMPPPLGGKKDSRSSLNDGVYRSRSGSPLRSSLCPRLPPPPDVSSLKPTKRTVDEQGVITDYNVADLDFETEKKMNKETLRNTQANSGSSNGFTQSAFANLNELEDRLNPKNSNAQKLSKGTAGNEKKKTRKSFADMSDKELAELEDFYASQSRSSASAPTIDKFDFREQNPLFLDDITKKNSSNIDPLAAIYPSRPVVNHRAISITLEHKDYEQFVENVNIRTGSKKPEESLVALRIVNCYISGKRYTWSSADWYVENMIENGDHLVIVTTIPFFEKEVEESDDALSWKRRSQTHKLERMMSAEHIMGISDSDNESKSTDNGTTNSADHLSKSARIQAIHEEARKKCNKILSYYASRIGDKIVKITIEMIKDENLVDAMTKAAALYKPDIQIVSTVSTNLQIKFRNGFVKLPFFVMRHYSMPIVVIPFEFIDPRVLGEDVTVTSEEKVKEKVKLKAPCKGERVELLDSIIERTLVNPFLSESRDECDKDKFTDNDNDSVVASVNEYFPISPEKKRDIESFERLGYRRAPPTRANFFATANGTGNVDGSRLHPVSTGGSSKRSSRIQYDDGIYKVKSLIDDLSDEGDARNDRKQTPTSYSRIRKTKSMGGALSSTSSPPQSGSSTSKHPMLSKFKSQNDSIPSSSTSRNTGNSSSNPANSAPTKTKKKGFASLFRKVFK
ncbi:hypothetical protein HG535_0E01090 [Zygotorulaspora mrakii]|uniref:Uncharacterized protein n=1 Tax=Zygotorulaspora mrakii TaxID=42260 RepID=A0A7H9B2Y3_ZYGMR|nr:uncharacterized protein HG535_0E01090 [Zygotorulaspora mrakii]QLG73025.1 hypothetical protein HG535_0E01090 [Zygotorulaspora mrakii]